MKKYRKYILSEKNIGVVLGYLKNLLANKEFTYDYFKNVGQHPLKFTRWFQNTYEKTYNFDKECFKVSKSYKNYLKDNNEYNWNFNNFKSMIEIRAKNSMWVIFGLSCGDEIYFSNNEVIVKNNTNLNTSKIIWRLKIKKE